MSVSLIDGHIDREKQTMTDNEIIKALSDLVKSTERIKHGGTKKVIVGAELLKDILNFINGKDEQIESLIAGQATLQKFIAEKDKEFEKIQKENTELDGANILLTVTLQNAKSEAVKEFAESVTYCKDCVKRELMTSNNQYFCNKFGGYVSEKDCCSRGVPYKRKGG